MALYSTLIKLDGHQVDIQDRTNVRNVVDRMHSCLISALLRKDESDNRDATHQAITDDLFSKWEQEQKSKIAALKKPESTPLGVVLGKTRAELDANTQQDVTPTSQLRKDFLMLDDHELTDSDNQYPRKHRPPPPLPILPKNRKWRGKHKKLHITRSIRSLTT